VTISFAPNEKVGPVRLEGLAGLAEIVVTGAVVSTVHVAVAVVPALPAASATARTRNVCGPSVWAT
jgi:hypothetical protein